MTSVIQLSRILAVAPDLGYPSHKTTLIARLAREGAEYSEGPATQGRRGFLYNVATLPKAIQDALTADNDVPQSPYQKAIAPQKAEAEGRLAIVLDVRELVARGVAWSTACAKVAEGCPLSAASVKNLWRLVKDRPEGDWLGLLVKRHKGSERHDYPEPIWAAFLQDYGRVEQPAAQAVYDRVIARAAREGWAPMPSLATLKRRWRDDVPALVKVQLRKGEKAADDLLPPAERDRSGMSPMDGWNGDYRLADVNVVFPDGSRGRLGYYLIQDEASGMPVSWAFTRSAGETESTDLICLGLLAGFERYGLSGTMRFDNTRAAANKAVTGKADFRFRGKIAREEAAGSLPRLGIKPLFTDPYNGRSKLVERLHLDLKERFEKDPRLAGAYVGRSPAHKPANYGEVFADYDLATMVFEEAVAECIDRPNRRGSTTFGRSIRQTFEEGCTARAVPVRCASAEELRRAFFRSQRCKVRNGTVRLGQRPHVNRFHCAELHEFEGQDVIVRYEPRNLAAPVDVENLTGRTIATDVPLLEKLGFQNSEDARTYARARRAAIKARKAEARALEAQAAALIGKPPSTAKATAAARPPVVKPTRFERTRAPAAADPEAEKEEQETRARIMRGRLVLQAAREEFGFGLPRAV